MHINYVKKLDMIFLKLQSICPDHNKLIYLVINMGVSSVDGKTILTYWPLRAVEVTLQAYFLNSFYKLISWSFPVKLVLGECHRTPLMKSTLVQVMAWCRQATSHHLSQCWPRSMLLYGIKRPQWVNILIPPWWRMIGLVSLEAITWGN